MDETDDERRARIHKLTATPIDDVIAETRLIGVFGSERRDIVLQIGRPYAEDDGVWRCPAAAWGLYGRGPDICGDDSFQALQLAGRLLETVVMSAVEDGVARFLPPDGEDSGKELDSDTAIAYVRAVFGTTKSSRQDRV